MKINFIGSFDVGYVGELADETHLAKNLELLGNQVHRMPRDIWKAYCDGEMDDNWKQYLDDLKADINIICKWHHFNDPKYIRKLKERSQAPVFYWVWDWMDGFPHGHKELIQEADVYLGNDVFDYQYKDLKNCYYFPFDCSSEEFDRVKAEKKYDVVFFGSHVGQGDRIEWIKEINKTHKIVCYSVNEQDWIKQGIEAYHSVFGKDFAQKVAETKICLGFSVVPNRWGYWSNRVGKVLTVGGFLLYQYAPGMELFLRDGVDYFSSIEEANKKIDFYLKNDKAREKIAERGYQIGRERFTSQTRIKDLMILIERYLKTHGTGWYY